MPRSGGNWYCLQCDDAVNAQRGLLGQSDQKESANYCLLSVIVVFFSTLPYLPYLSHAFTDPLQRIAIQNAMVWRWAVARVMYVMWEHEPDIIKAAHDIQSDDEVGRLLHHGT